MEFDDPRWDSLQGGYRVPYDPRKALSALERGKETESAWQELCTELYHQGDVGEASYAAVPTSSGFTPSGAFPTSTHTRWLP